MIEFFFSLATIVLAGYTYWYFSHLFIYIRVNILFGCILGGGAVLNLMRYFGKAGDTKNDEPML